MHAHDRDVVNEDLCKLPLPSAFGKHWHELAVPFAEFIVVPSEAGGVGFWEFVGEAWGSLLRGQNGLSGGEIIYLYRMILRSKLCFRVSRQENRFHYALQGASRNLNEFYVEFRWRIIFWS